MGNQHVIHVPNGTVTILQDGYVELEAGSFSNLPEPVASGPLPQPSDVNGFLYQTEGQTILVDTGGQGMMPGLGGLAASLNQLGMAPEDIDTIFLTHIHPDHVGGMFVDGKAVFQNAKVVLHEQELAFWSNPESQSRLIEPLHGFLNAAIAMLDVYADQLAPFDNETDLLPGALVVPLPGHTPGHSGLQIGSGDDGLFVWGDIIHVPEFQLLHPGASIAFDVDPERAAATRASVLGRATAERLRIVGGHMPGMGRVDKSGSGYTFVSAT